MSRKVMSQKEAGVLKIEAERRVREGQSRAEVGRALGIAPMTLAQWALAGGWRRVDLEKERASELVRMATQRIDAAEAREAESDAALREALAEARERGRLAALGRRGRFEVERQESMPAPDPLADFDWQMDWPSRSREPVADRLEQAEAEGCDAVGKEERFRIDQAEALAALNRLAERVNRKLDWEEKEKQP